MLSLLSQSAARILKQAFGMDAAVTWQLPQETAHGDMATSVALQLGKRLGKPPREIAEQLALGLRSHDSVARVDVAGAGYVNVFLKPEVLVGEVRKVREVVEAKPTRKEAPVIIEYSQPNIAKPLGIHHLIGTALGQALVNLYRHQGYPVIAWNYLGDWGTQFGKLAVAFSKWGDKPIERYSLDELLGLYVQFHQEAESQSGLEDEGRAASKKLEDGDPELRAFWEAVVRITKGSLSALYERLQVSFDLDLGESFYEDKMEPLIDQGKKKGVFTDGEKGALIVRFPEEKYPPYLILRGDGATLYSTRDLAQMRYRIDTYHPRAIFICTDIAQKLHFEQLVETCRMLGWELPEFENVLFGRMRFADSSMSTRKGTVLKLEHILDEAVDRAREIIRERGEAIQTDDPEGLAEMMGVGALAYGILSQNRKMDLVFSWEKMLSFEGNSAPYLQYTHARARSVLRKDTAGSMPALDPCAFTSHERVLMRSLLTIPMAIEDARESRMPHKLANTLYQLAQDFNAFYNADAILHSDEPSRSFRLELVRLTADALRTGLALLTIRVPDRM